MKDVFILQESETIDKPKDLTPLDKLNIGWAVGATGVVALGVSAFIYAGIKVSYNIYKGIKNLAIKKSNEAPIGKKAEVKNKIMKIAAKKAIIKLGSLKGKAKTPKEKALINKQILKYKKKLK